MLHYLDNNSHLSQGNLHQIVSSDMKHDICMKGELYRLENINKKDILYKNDIISIRSIFDKFFILVFK